MPELSHLSNERYSFTGIEPKNARIAYPFKIIFTKSPKSPFDVAGAKTKATTKDILEAVRESRTGDAGPVA